MTTFTFTITPIPSDAVVTFYAVGFTQTDNTITVDENTSVNYSVTKEGYITRIGTEIITENKTLPISLQTNWEITDRLNNVATYVGENNGNDFFVVDAQYRSGANIWQKLIATTPLTKYSNFVEAYNSTTSATENTNNIFDAFPLTAQAWTDRWETNFTNIGGVIISEDWIASGFSYSKYLQIGTVPFNSATNWEIGIKVTTGNDVTTDRYLIGDEPSSYSNLIKLNNAKFGFNVSSSHTYHFAAQMGTTTITANTEYWIKFQFTGSRYILSLSLDGQTWNEECSASSSTKISTSVWDIGGTSGYNVWGGSVDLNESYIKINGEDWWIPYTTKAEYTLGYTYSNATVNDYIYRNLDATNATKILTKTSDSILTNVLNSTTTITLNKDSELNSTFTTGFAPVAINARNALSTTFYDNTYNSQLPTFKQLYQIYNHRVELDLFDDTLASYPNNALEDWNIDSNSNSLMWSSNEYNLNKIWTIKSDGYIYNINKFLTAGVTPIIEIPKLYNITINPTPADATVDFLGKYTNQILTSNTTNNWVASASITSGTNAPYKSFNGLWATSENCWYTGGTSYPVWIQLYNPTLSEILSVRIKNEISSPKNFRNAIIQGSVDGVTYDDLYTITDRPSTTGLDVTYEINSTQKYHYMRLYITSSWTSGVSIQQIEVNYDKTTFQVGNTTYKKYGETATVTVSKTGYITQTNSYIITNNQTVDITLEPEST